MVKFLNQKISEELPSETQWLVATQFGLNKFLDQYPRHSPFTEEFLNF